ncbi:MAG: RNB domain-containing ribonuclease, partial [Lachnospiraceae bacterium]|nr:RNB domain-containing ribonuclease [Lachnospiraceae bacterium]
MKEIYVGTFLAHPKGFGFVRVEGLEEDIFVHSRRTHHAFHEDLVEVRVLPEDRGRGGRWKDKRSSKGGQEQPSSEKRKEGIVNRILSHTIKTVVGTFYPFKKKSGLLLSDNERLPERFFVPKGQTGEAKKGDKVVLQITDYGSHGAPEGKVLEILGKEDAPGVDLLAIAKSLGLNLSFSEKVLNKAKGLDKPVSEADILGRRDLRELLTVTIDGEHSKDFDDAVSLTMEEGDYFLGVHIADVANYVQENSALDMEARKRGNSAYLINLVLPMLPEALSNGICSLNPEEERLTLSCLMRVSKEGEVLSHEICESVIISKRRMTYTEVNAILTEKEAAKGYDKELIKMLKGLHRLSKALRRARKKRGAIDFDFPEAEITLSKKGFPLEVQARTANEATRLIEDCMLCANETVAEHFFKAHVP